MKLRALRLWQWLTHSRFALLLAMVGLSILIYQQWSLSNNDVLTAELEREGNWLLKPILLDRAAMLPVVPDGSYSTIGIRLYDNFFRGPWLAGKRSALVNLLPTAVAVQMDETSRIGVPKREDEDFVFIAGESVKEGRFLIGKSGNAYKLNGDPALEHDPALQSQSCKNSTWSIEGTRLVRTQSGKRSDEALPANDTWTSIYVWGSGDSCRGVLTGASGTTLELVQKTEHTDSAEWIRANLRGQCRAVSWSIETGSLRTTPDTRLAEAALATPLESDDRFTAIRMWRGYGFDLCTGWLISKKGRILQYYDREKGPPSWLDAMHVGSVSRTRWVRWIPAPWWLGLVGFLLVLIATNIRRSRLDQNKISQSVSTPMRSQQEPTPAGRPEPEEFQHQSGRVPEIGSIPETPSVRAEDSPTIESSATSAPRTVRADLAALIPSILAAIVLLAALAAGWYGPVESGAIHSSREQPFWRSRVDGPYPVDERITTVYHSNKIPMYYFVAAGGQNGSVFLSEDLGATWSRERPPVKFPILAISLVGGDDASFPIVNNILEIGDQYGRSQTFRELRILYSNGIVASRKWGGEWQIRMRKEGPFPEKPLVNGELLRSESFPYATAVDQGAQRWCFNRAGWSRALKAEASEPLGKSQQQCPEEGRDHSDHTVGENAGDFRLHDDPSAAQIGSVVLWALNGNNQIHRGPKVHRIFVLGNAIAMGPSRSPFGLLMLLPFAAAFGLFLSGFRPLKPILSFRDNVIFGIRRSGVSDSPVDHPSDDELDFWARTRATADHIMNPATSLPMCLAVEGEWGTGKTSYMKLLRRHLVNRGCQTVWINPWHHKAEDSFLAAVLEGLRREGSPSLLSWSGLRYRSGLLYIRWGWPWLLLLLGAAWLMWERDTINALVTKLFGPHWDAVNKLFLGGLGLISLERLWSSLKFIRANPASELLAASNGLSSSQLAEKLSLRHRASAELSDSLKALAPGRLVVFFDDLDRCSPTDLVTCLETCNFLATAGPLVLVIGMSRRHVQSTMQTAFEATAKSIGVPTETYCQEYLKKIIQQRVEIGCGGSPDVKRVVCRRLANPSTIGSSFAPYDLVTEWRWRREYDPGFRWLVNAKTIARQILFESAIITLGIAVIWFIWPGLQLFSPQALQLSAPPHFLWVILTSIAVWAIIRLVLRALLPPNHHEDGETYESAAPLWADFIYHRSRNLREIKRFLARARFYASQHDLPLTESEVLQIVACSALEEAFPEHPVNRREEWPPEGTALGEEAIEALRIAIEFNKEKGAWPPIPPQPRSSRPKKADPTNAVVTP